MTGFISFTTDSFKKRKELVHLLYIQIFATFIMYYLVILANILTASFYKSSAQSFLNASVSNYWGAFYVILSVVAIVFASAVVFYTLKLMIFYQTKEISIMMAVGGLLETIENFYLVQLVLMSLISNIIGILFGYILVFISLLIVSIFIPTDLLITIPFPDYQLILIFIFFFFVIYFVSAKSVSSVITRYNEDLIQDKVDFNNGKDDNILSRLFIWGKRSKEGFIHLTTRIARLNIMRHSFVFIISIIINILYAFFIISLVFGTLIVSDTTSNISYTGIGGDNTAIIINKNYADFFTNSFQLSSKTSTSDFNFTDSLFNYKTVVTMLTDHNLSTIDDRIILQKNVNAYSPATNVNPNNQNNNPSGNNLGSVRYVTPFVIAINPEHSIPFWNYYGSDPKNITGNNLFVGEQFAYDSFQSPMDGVIRFPDSIQTAFTIKSIILDPIFKGNTLYINMNTFDSLYKPDTNLRNLLFVRIPNSDTFNAVSSELAQLNPNLSIISLHGVIAHNADYITYLSVNLLSVGIPLFVIYFFINEFYNRQIIEERKQQLNLLKILGSNLNNYRSVIIKEVDAYSFWGLLIGFLLALYFIIEMTVPFPIISLFSIFISISVLIIPYFIIRRRLIQQIDEIYQNYLEAFWV